MAARDQAEIKEFAFFVKEVRRLKAVNSHRAQKALRKTDDRLKSGSFRKSRYILKR